MRTPKRNDDPPDGPESQCVMCGLLPSACICPDCPECGENGNSDCYRDGYLVESQEQRDSRKQVEDWAKIVNSNPIIDEDPSEELPW